MYYTTLKYIVSHKRIRGPDFRCRVDARAKENELTSFLSAPQYR